MLHGLYDSDRRSRQQFLDEIEKWRDNALEEPESGIHELASQMSRPFVLKVSNNTTTSLKEVRLEVTFDAPVTALYWEEQDNNTVDLFPNRPLDWGQNSYLSAVSLSGFPPAVTSVSFDGSIRIDAERPAMLVVEMARLHTEQSLSAPDEDVVLLLFADGPDAVPNTVTAHGRLTAGEVHEVLRGEFQLEMAAADWRGPLHSTIVQTRGGGPEGDE